MANYPPFSRVSDNLGQMDAAVESKTIFAIYEVYRELEKNDG